MCNASRWATPGSRSWTGRTLTSPSAPWLVIVLVYFFFCSLSFFRGGVGLGLDLVLVLVFLVFLL